MTENHVLGMETSAITVLKRAVELEQTGRSLESLVCYQEGIQLLMDVLKGPYFAFAYSCYSRCSMQMWTIIICRFIPSCQL